MNISVLPTYVFFHNLLGTPEICTPVESFLADLDLLWDMDLCIGYLPALLKQWSLVEMGRSGGDVFVFVIFHVILYQYVVFVKFGAK